MEITLESIDAVRERTGASYADAKEALEKSGGSVVDAIVLLENKSGVKTDEIIAKIKALVKEGNVNRAGQPRHHRRSGRPGGGSAVERARRGRRGLRLRLQVRDHQGRRQLDGRGVIPAKQKEGSESFPLFLFFPIPN